MKKLLAISLLVGASVLSNAQTSFDENKVFLATLGESSRQELKRHADQKDFDEKRLLKLLALSGGRVGIPKTKIKTWTDYSLSFPDSVQIKNSKKFYDEVVTKIDSAALGDDQNKNYPERALAKIIFQRELLDHYLKSKKYIDALEARAKLEAMSAEAKKKK